ncbi:MAG: tetratricopeptide repeat protein, partial [Verrucomicrobiota bacterium]
MSSRFPFWLIPFAFFFPAVADDSRNDSAAALSPKLLEQTDPFQAALRALEDDLPSVAATKLDRIFREQKDDLTPSARDLLLRTWMEALAHAGRYGDVLQLSDRTFFQTSPDVVFWKGLALGQTGDLRAALKLLQPLARQKKTPYQASAALTGSAFLLRMQRPEAAIEILQPLFRSETDPETQALALLQAAEIHTDLARPEEAQALLRLIREDTSPSIQRRLRFLEANTALLMGDPETAVLRASELLTSLRQKDRNLANRTVFLLSEASAQAGDQESAISVLQSFVLEQPTSDRLPEAFQRLEELGFFANRHVAVASWKTSSSPEVR